MLGFGLLCDLRLLVFDVLLVPVADGEEGPLVVGVSAGSGGAGWVGLVRTVQGGVSAADRCRWVFSRRRKESRVSSVLIGSIRQEYAFVHAKVLGLQTRTKWSCTRLFCQIAIMTNAEGFATPVHYLVVQQSKLQTSDVRWALSGSRPEPSRVGWIHCSLLHCCRLPADNRCSTNVR